MFVYVDVCKYKCDMHVSVYCIHSNFRIISFTEILKSSDKKILSNDNSYIIAVRDFDNNINKKMSWDVAGYYSTSLICSCKYYQNL